MNTRKDHAELSAAEASQSAPQVGLLIVYTPFMPKCCFVPLRGETLRIGRDELIALGIHEEYASQRHLRLDWNGKQFTVRDEGSTNGTILNGQALRAPAVVDPPAVIRIGRTLALCVNEPWGNAEAEVRSEGGVIVGPRMQAFYRQIDLIAASGESLLIVGESGAGKELAARRFHTAGTRAGAPFVAVNCATIPRELAERLLFGARRGAYSGAVADADGHIQAAHGGTLFLDEVVDLELANQTKLLRVIENREVQALGANRPQRVELRLCAAAQRDLRQEVARGRFREDLYFRIGRPELRIPPLRERPEEIPWFIDAAVRDLLTNLQKPRGVRLSVSTAFIEACLLRPWPGNVRELRAEVRSAALRAVQEGATTLGTQHLGDEAGRALPQAPEPTAVASRPTAAAPTAAAPNAEDPERCEAVLRSAHGNINRAAEELGVTRSKMRRLIERFQIDIERLRRPS